MLSSRIFVLLLVSSTLCLSIICVKDWTSDLNSNKWNTYSKNKLDNMLNRHLNGNVAKNIILFLGDGMGFTTVTVIISIFLF